MARTHDKMQFVSEGNAMLCSAVFSYDKMYNDIHCEVKKADEQAGVLCSRKGILL